VPQPAWLTCGGGQTAKESGGVDWAVDAAKALLAVERRRVAVPWNRQSATSSAVFPACTTLRVVSWIVGSIATYSVRALRIALMPRAGPLRAIRNPSNAYKATSASRSPEFSACSKWRSSGDAAELTCCHAISTATFLRCMLCTRSSFAQK